MNHTWRLFGTGLSFLLFGLGGLMLGLVIFPLLHLLTPDPVRRQHRARRMIGTLFWLFIRIMSGLGVISYDIKRDNETAPDGNCLIVANHPTLIDVVFLIALFPQADCVVKAALWNNPFTRHVLQAANHIPNEDGADLIEHCVARLRAGGTLILFPEGTRTRRDRKLRFKAGAAAIAVRADSQLLPVLIDCRPLTLGKSEPWYDIPMHRPAFSFHVLASSPVAAFIGAEGTDRERHRALNEALKEFFISKLDGWT